MTAYLLIMGAYLLRSTSLVPSTATLLWIPMDNISNHRVSVCKLQQTHPLWISLQTSALESVLAGAGVHVRNRDDVMQKVAAIAQDGPDKLLVRTSETYYISLLVFFFNLTRMQFLSDFDQTLTRYWVNGERGFTSYSNTHFSSHGQLCCNAPYVYPIQRLLKNLR